MRSQMFGRESRAAYFASAQAASELHVDILMRLHKAAPAEGYDSLALDSSERRRARGLLELLTEAGMDLRTGVDAKLVQRERALEKQLNTLAASEVQSPRDAESRDHRIDRTRHHARRTGARAPRDRDPQHQPACTRPSLIPSRSPRATFKGTCSITTRFSSNSCSARSGATMGVVQGLAGKPRAAETQGGRGRRDRSVLDLVTRQGASATEASRRLSQMVLGPFANELRGKRLAIVADGALQDVPFAMLPSPERSAGSTRSQRDVTSQTPLIVNHEIVTLPSASTLGIIRRELARRTPARDGIAVIADPVFSAGDERLKGTTASTHAGSPAPAGAENTRLLAHLAGATAANGAAMFIPRSPFTRQEADRILGIKPDAANLKALDLTASKALVTSGRLATNRHVDFATHGHLDSERPGFSALVLSMVDEKGLPQDGFLGRKTSTT